VAYVFARLRGEARRGERERERESKAMSIIAATAAGLRALAVPILFQVLLFIPNNQS
jgi:hypothetical protein